MYDFRDVPAASKAEQIRAWSLELASDILNTSEPSSDMIIKMASAIEDYIVNGAEVHNAETMDKVHEALRENGYLPDDIPVVISAFQNRGILFRERA